MRKFIHTQLSRYCNAALAATVSRIRKTANTNCCKLVSGLLLVFACMLTLPATAIVIRHDKSDASYVVDAKKFPQLFFLHTRDQHRVCVATLISARWAITAGHCIDDTPIRSTMANNARYELQLDGQSFNITQLVMHPEYQNGKLLHGVDLALIQLDRDVSGVTPVMLNKSTDEADKIAILLGWGYTGTGTSGRFNNDGKFRRAENTVDAANLWLQFSFDDPRVPNSTALNLEGVPGLGDSGGPALLESEQGYYLLGVAIGELEREDTAVRQGVYGATEVYERISQHLDWIEYTIGLD